MEAGGGRGLKNDINVVPLIDIVLVLLIIFMVMTPMMQRGYDMNIPEKAPPDQLVSQPPADQMVLEMVENPSGDPRILLNKQDIAVADLQPKLEELFIGRRNKIVFFTAGKNVFYQEVISVMDIIRSAGGQVGIVTTM